MCRDIRIWKQDADDCMFQDLGETVICDTPVLCTCWLGSDPQETITEEELAELHYWFMEKLRPYLGDSRVGDIIIEIM